MPNVIHFVDFEELIPELDPMEIIRVNVFSNVVFVHTDFPEVTDVRIGVHVRQISPNAVLSWMMATGQCQFHRDAPIDDQNDEIFESANEEAELIYALVVKRLLDDEQLILKPRMIRPGIIDLGQTITRPGTWALLEVEDVTVEATPSTSTK